ncbi:hypothetical protein ACQP00_43130 [Dactylosporangium sp. CS-047395]|uniref:hypothetical protein n=1 Tax=Dactylosporangium sp. CS-047395 TaxID=3239936 RepID=UPI003D8BA05B
MMARIATAFAAVVLLLLIATPAQAHGGASVTIHSDGHGSVWITAQWQDGHPINEPTTVTMTAGSLPPAVLHQTGDERGTQTYSGTLDPGSWRVAIDLGTPVNGHCQALIQVADPAATAQPTEVACLIPATQASAPAAAPSSSGGSLTPLWITLGALVVAGGGFAFFRSRRS